MVGSPKIRVAKMWQSFPIVNFRAMAIYVGFRTVYPLAFRHLLTDSRSDFGCLIGDSFDVLRRITRPATMCGSMRYWIFTPPVVR